VQITVYKPSEAIGLRVDAGDVIGHAQNLQMKYASTMTHHVHVEIRVNGKVAHPHFFIRDGQ
jgi:hypothetical protein